MADDTMQVYLSEKKRLLWKLDGKHVRMSVMTTDELGVSGDIRGILRVHMNKMNALHAPKNSPWVVLAYVTLDLLEDGKIDVYPHRIRQIITATETEETILVVRL